MDQPETSAQIKKRARDGIAACQEREDDAWFKQLNHLFDTIGELRTAEVIAGVPPQEINLTRSLGG